MNPPFVKTGNQTGPDEGRGLNSVWKRIAWWASRNPEASAIWTPARTVRYGELFAGRHFPGPVWNGRTAIALADPLETLLDVLAAGRAGLVPAVFHEYDAARSALKLETAGRPPDPREALILNTSGTTGMPKLVCLPHRSLLLNVETIGKDLALTPGDRVLAASPLSHSLGLVGSALTTLAAGAELHLFEPGTPALVLQAHLRRACCTVVQGTATFYRLFFLAWNGEPFPAMRMVTVAGEPVEPAMVAKLAAAFPNARNRCLYGLTECGPRVSHVPLDDPRTAHGWIGRPFTHYAWRIDPVADSEEPGGQLQVKGDSVMLGYLAEDGCYTGLTEDGFLPTRDRVVPGEAGDLYWRGRLDGCFKVGGRLVAPMAVERVVRGLAGVGLAHCVGEPHPLLGAAVALNIVPDTGAGLTVEAVNRWCMERLPAHQRPRVVRLVESIPLTISGKIKRPRNQSD